MQLRMPEFALHLIKDDNKKAFVKIQKGCNNTIE